MTVTDPNMTSTDPLTNIVMTGIRDLVKLGGGYLVGAGVLNSSQLQLWGGLAVVVAGVIWSSVASYLKSKKMAVATAAVSNLAGSPVEAAVAMATAKASLSK